MLINCSAPPATVTPVLVYEDVRASAQTVLSWWSMWVASGSRQAAAV
jgi:hypothetical protein